MSDAFEKTEKSQLDEAVARYFADKSPDNLEAVFDAGKRLVRHFACVYSGGRLNEDLVQAGYVGFMKALESFDDTRGCLFSTYAGHCIMGEIRHCIRKETAYYSPSCIADLQCKYDKLVHDYYCACGRLPSLEYIADKLNVKPEGIKDIMKAGLVSFDSLNTEHICSLRYESFKLPVEDRILLEQAMKKLTDLQKKVLYLLYYKDMTQVQVAKKLRLNQRKVSRVHIGGLANLRNMMLDEY